MAAEIISLQDLSETNLASWRELASRALEPNPTHEPEYVMPLARGLEQEGDVELVVVRDADVWQACLPTHRGPWHRMPLPSVASWRGHYLYGLLGTPLIAPDRPGETLDELIAAAVGGAATFVALEDVASNGPLWPFLEALIGQSGSRALLIEQFERAAVRRRPSPTYLDEGLSGRRRKELRRQRRKLNEALGEEAVVVDRSGDDSAYDELIRLEAKGRKAERRTVLADDPGHVRFFIEMCRGFAAMGRLQMLTLQGGGETIAMQCNLLAGDTIFGVKIAYDGRWAALGPGVQLEVEGIRIFHDETSAMLMDSCADPDNAMLNRLWPDRRSLRTYALPAPGVRGRIARPALRMLRTLRRWNRARRNAGWN